MSTLPHPEWLHDYMKLLESNNDVVFGVTKYKYKTNIQKLIHFSTFGFTPRESNPGTLSIKKNIYQTKY